MRPQDEIDYLIANVKSELAELESRRSELLARLAELQQGKTAQLYLKCLFWPKCTPGEKPATRR